MTHGSLWRCSPPLSMRWCICGNTTWGHVPERATMTGKGRQVCGACQEPMEAEELMGRSTMVDPSIFQLEPAIIEEAKKAKDPELRIAFECIDLTNMVLLSTDIRIFMECVNRNKSRPRGLGRSPRNRCEERKIEADRKCNLNEIIRC